MIELTEAECRELLNAQPSWNLGPFSLLNLGYRAGLAAGIERAAKKCIQIALEDDDAAGEFYAVAIRALLK